jgi:hypothetical protein
MTCAKMRTPSFPMDKGDTVPGPSIGRCLWEFFAVPAFRQDYDPVPGLGQA